MIEFKKKELLERFTDQNNNVYTLYSNDERCHWECHGMLCNEELSNNLYKAYRRYLRSECDD